MQTTRSKDADENPSCFASAHTRPQFFVSTSRSSASRRLASELSVPTVKLAEPANGGMVRP